MIYQTLTKSSLSTILENAHTTKKARSGWAKGIPDADAPLRGCVLAMIFEKPSTRTRVSFDVGMRQLGGETLMLSVTELQLGRGETIADTARVLSRFVDAIMIRASAHHKLLELAEFAEVPVINGLTDLSHPCQVMADLMTLQEKKGPIENLTVAWTGDCNNVTTSWIHAAARFGFQLNVASPESLQISTELQNWANENGANLKQMSDPVQAVQDADCVVTDTWLSMNDDEGLNRHNLLKPYQVNNTLMGQAKSDAIFMHCLPAHRGEEVIDDVIDGPQSVVLDEAENRLHAQKAILTACLSGRN